MGPQPQCIVRIGRFNWILEFFRQRHFKAFQTVRLIETGHLIETYIYMRLYGTFNRDLLKQRQTGTKRMSTINRN